MEFKQPCPRCGCHAGAIRKGLRPVTYLYSPDGEIDDIEAFPSDDRMADTFRCRHEGCGAPLVEESDNKS